MNLLSNILLNDLRDKKVLLRAGLNTPLDASGAIVDNFRIFAAIPTLEYLISNTKQVVIIAHLGRGREDTLRPVFLELQKHFPSLYFTQMRDLKEAMLEHNLILVENIRQDPREVSSDEQSRSSLAKELAIIMGKDSIFVQDAFSVCHRTHASIISLPKFMPSYAGLLVEEEVKYLRQAMDPPKPSLFVLGGAKFATKEPLIRKFLKIYDRVFIGGAIANEFFKSKGYEVGKSLVHNGSIPHDILYSKQIILPDTVRVADADGHTIYISPDGVTSDMRIVDAVPPSNLLQDINSDIDVRYILWNGPLGYYEGGFSQGTDRLLDMFANSDAQILTGGGDTMATVGAGKHNIFSHISSGGGAMLAFLQDGDLVGLKALA